MILFDLMLPVCSKLFIQYQCECNDHMSVQRTPKYKQQTLSVFCATVKLLLLFFFNKFVRG